jgi:hypothetical protein
MRLSFEGIKKKEEKMARKPKPSARNISPKKKAIHGAVKSPPNAPNPAQGSR